MIKVAKGIKKLSLPLTVMAMFATYGCGSKSTFSSGSGSKKGAEGSNKIVVSANSDDLTGKKNPYGGNEDEELRKAQVDVGIKNYLQINSTFSSLTGVPTTNNDVLNTYNDVKTQLPTGNSLKTFSASVQVGVAKLAMEYCNAMMGNQALRSTRVPGVDFTAGPAAAFGGTGGDALVDGLISSFWLDDASGPDRAASKTMLKSLLGELQVGVANNAQQTSNIASGTCAAVLASSATTFL